MLNHLAILEIEVKQLVLSHRAGFTIEQCNQGWDKFSGDHWIVVSKRGKGRKTEYVYDTVVYLPNRRLVWFEDIYKPTTGSISFTLNEKE